jgi:hypothetical protein
MIFALHVLGISATKRTALGARGLPSSLATTAFNPERKASEGSYPGFNTTKVTTGCPLISSGTPTAAALIVTEFHPTGPQPSQKIRKFNF